ncbi:outer membrane beta-barrel protein [Nibribacter ruber]|uniref:Outer membrane beta-barrel protein n=1 Tax=Nibribacter ruber TaxID=2698458 RepID=A0A6P1NXZ1_9BACT|nr:outer membrane beta-barrel protein [Nibribacter ruber]QHL87079.1 outer membrane beta-barrel protein [Nibribacter ruber]
MKRITLIQKMWSPVALGLVALVSVNAQAGTTEGTAPKDAPKTETILLASNATAAKAPGLTLTYREATSSYKPFSAKRAPQAAVTAGVGELKIGYVVAMKGSKPNGMFGPISATFDKALNVELGPGVISAGAGLSFANWSDDEYEIESSLTTIVISPRATYHLDLLQNDNLDLYGGLAFNFAIANYSAEYTGNDPDVKKYFQDVDESDTDSELALLAGATYYFTEKFGGFLEVSTGDWNRASLGVAIKF